MDEAGIHGTSSMGHPANTIIITTLPVILTSYSAEGTEDKIHTIEVGGQCKEDANNGLQAIT